MFRTNLPKGQPRSLRTIAESKNEPANLLSEDEDKTRQDYASPADSVKRDIKMPPIAPPSPFRITGGK